MFSQMGKKIKRTVPSFIYYKRFGTYYLCVVAKHLNNEGFIITCYFTKKIKEGEEIWKK